MHALAQGPLQYPPAESEAGTPVSKRSDCARSVDQTRAVLSAELEAKYWPPGHAAVSHTGNTWPLKVARFAGPFSSCVLHSLTVLCVSR